MAKQKSSGLGKGLGAIFLDNGAEPDNNGTSVLRISDIEPRPDQPRKKFETESLAKLADSISVHGLLQPIIVRASAGGFYQIIAGERRWRAAKMAGLTEVPVSIIETDDKTAAELALIENIQREELNPIDEAGAYRSLIEEYDMTQEEVSRRIGRSRSAVANSLRLLELPPEVTAKVISGDLSAGHARALLALKDEEMLIKAAETVVNKELSVRDTEKLVKLMNSVPEEKEEQETVKVDYNAVLEKRIETALGRRVKITAGKRSKKIEIEFADNEDLEELLKKLCGSDFFEE